MHEPGRYILLALAALAAGAVNSIAGGGTLLTFPALTLFVPAEVANATSTIALLPGSLAGAWGYRKEVVTLKSTVMLLIGPSLVGGLLGALFVVWFPDQFKSMVPWLILLAAVLFLIQPMVSRFLKSRSKPASPDVEARPGTRTKLGIVVFQFFVAVYGGYFGAGIGILMLAALGIMAIGDIHKMNGVKTVLATAINTASVAVFLSRPGIIHWQSAIVMALASIAGGYLGARIARKLPANLVRRLVIAIGFGLAAYYFWRQFSSPAS
ncbi:MAG: sulfite exporter TauE/SafE family protein [Gemmataceae bacterium]